MEYAVAVALHHLGVNIKARVAQLCDFLRQQLHAVDRVAEDDRLIYLQLHGQHRPLSLANAGSICLGET